MLNSALPSAAGFLSQPPSALVSNWEISVSPRLDPKATCNSRIPLSASRAESVSRICSPAKAAPSELWTVYIKPSGAEASNNSQGLWSNVDRPASLVAWTAIR